MNSRNVLNEQPFASKAIYEAALLSLKVKLNRFVHGKNGLSFFEERLFCSVVTPYQQVCVCKAFKKMIDYHTISQY